MQKRVVTFNLTTGQKTIKLFTLHPKKPWIAVVTNYNTFSLWNYQQKILIKSFNCNSLDQSGNVDVKQLVFYDKHCLSYQNQTLTSMRNNIIFATNFKIFFYDHITDGIKQINESQIQKKNIRKICPYSQTKICIGLSDGSLKLYDNKDTIKNSMTIKTIKGFHTKPITHVFTYCQSKNQSPRVISVSGSDGLMSCWNMEMTLSNPNMPDSYSPSFKFQRQGGTKINQQIKCLQYDKETYKLVTLSDSWISIWSTMTGMEMKRIKNQFRFKEIYFFNHFSYGPNSFVGFSQGINIVLLTKLSPAGKLNVISDIDLKNFSKQGHTSTIRHILNWPGNPSQLFIQTQLGITTIEINSSYRPTYGFNSNFTTNLSTINSKQFVIKNQNRINPTISTNQARSAKLDKDILFNCFYLSVDQEWIYFNLIQTQIDNVLHEHKKYKFFKPEPSSLLNLSEGSQSVIEPSYDGKSFIIFNKPLEYYEVLSVIQNQEQDNLLDMQQKSNSIDFYSQFEVIAKGMCKDITWHQYKNQFAVICPFDKKGQLVTYEVQKQKKGIFGNKSKSNKPSDKKSGQIDHWCACIFVFSRNSKRYLMIQKSKSIKSAMYRILNLGTIYCYSSSQKSSAQTIQCFSQDQNLIRQIQGIGFFPLKVYVSYCQTYQLFVYQTYFVVFKLQQNGYMAYHLTVNQKVLEGMFWQKFFIFATKNQMFFLHLLSTGKILIKIADSSPNFILQKSKSAFESELIDEIQSCINIMPQGQLHFLTIVNVHLIIVNQNQNIQLFPLNKNPYIQFCIQLICGSNQKISKIYKRSSQDIKQLIKQTLQQYGMTIPNIEAMSTQLIF